MRPSRWCISWLILFNDARGCGIVRLVPPGAADPAFSKGDDQVVSAPVRFPRFFVTSPGPCPYLPGRVERKVFAELKGDSADELNDALSRIGFRRSQTVAYRPSCQGCNACVSVRVAAHEFTPSSSQRRTIRQNSDLIVSRCKPWSTPEQYELLQAYLAVRHPGGGMAAMDDTDFADMVEHTPVRSYVIEYREPNADGTPGRLVGACLTDHQGDGLSMVYSFYDPHHPTRTGLGTFIILDHIRHASDIGLPYVYLGYWVEGSACMEYKVRFRPMERLGSQGWERFDPAEQTRAIDRVASVHRAGGDADTGKDGLAVASCRNA
jgi:leucyl-tRNA---protein transferase